MESKIKDAGKATIEGNEFPVYAGTHGNEVIDIRGGDGITGMGVVYIVREGAKKLAIKTFQSRYASELPLIQRFIREAQTWILAGFHPNIVRAYRLEILQAVPGLVMEYVPSNPQGYHSPSDYLLDGPLALPDALSYAAQFCAGMAHATAAVPGMVHRDLKPENLLINPDGVLKITDFGLVRLRAVEDDALALAGKEAEAPDTSERLTRAGMVFGTPLYMAPEQFRHADEVTAAADVYGFGCCLYEALTGSPPFLVTANETIERIIKLREKHYRETPRPLRDHLPDCPDALDAVVQRCLEKEPEDRWQSYTDMLQAFQQVAETTLGRRIPLPPREDPSPREVAQQMRSLNLLEGYDRAIRLRRLRDSQVENPYTFHLALASYFRVYDDRQEEREQLEKADFSRRHGTTVDTGGPAPGYEVVRRLGSRLLEDDEVDRATQLFDAFLNDYPDAVDAILDPYVAGLCRSGHIERARKIVIEMPNSVQRHRLAAVVAAAAEDRTAQIAALRLLLETVLERLAEKTMQIDPGESTGWAFDGDNELLAEVLETLAPEVDTNVLLVSDQSVWPDLAGYPDFSLEVGWLSDALGQLGDLLDAIEPERAETYRQMAATLGYPDRLRRHEEREESWFWMQHHQPDA